MALISGGTIFRRPGRKGWSIQFSVDGVQKRESAGTEDKQAALDVLRQRLEEARRGVYQDTRDRLTFQGMKDALLANYATRGNKSDPSANLARLAAFFGNVLAENIDETLVTEYAAKRLKRDKAAPATLHRELSILKRMFTICARRIPRVPYIELPRVRNARQGFFEEEQVQSVLRHLPEHARGLVEFLYLSGWRFGEAVGLRWQDVDLKREVVTLRDSKNGEPRLLPFAQDERLRGVIRAQREYTSRVEREQTRVVPQVFHYEGEELKKIRKSWARATALAGVPALLIHDLRRTAVRNLVKSGVPQAVAKKVTGHKTNAVFERYMIGDEEMLADALGRKAEYLKRGGAR